MAQEVKANDMTVGKWSESLGTSAAATEFKNSLFQQFDKNQALSDIAFMNSKDEIKSKFGSGTFGVAIGKALRPFWQTKSVQGGSQGSNKIEVEKSWNYDSKTFIKQIKAVFGEFKQANMITPPTEPKLIGNQMVARDSMKTELGRILVSRQADRKSKPDFKSREDREDHPISGIIGCPGSGKTSLLYSCFNFLHGTRNSFYKELLENFSQFETQNESKENESKENESKEDGDGDGDSDDDDDNDDAEMNTKEKGLTKKEKASVANAFEKIVCISVTYDSGNDPTLMDTQDDTDDEFKDEDIKLRFNTGFLWRVLYEIVDYNGTWDSFCDVVESYQNSKDLKCYTVSNILQYAFPDYAIILLIDEIKKLKGNGARNVVHTAAKLMSFRKQFVHAIVTCLVGTPFVQFKSGSGRPVAPLSCELFPIKSLLQLFAQQIELVKAKKQKEDVIKFLSCLLDTMGLPRLVRLFADECERYGANVATIVKEFNKQVTRDYSGVPKRNVKFIKKLLSKRNGFGVGATNELITNDYNDTWDSFQEAGFIQIERDGVYMSPIVLDAMMDSDARDIRVIVDDGMSVSSNYGPKLFEKLFYCNERLLGILFEGDIMSYPSYFNLGPKSKRISKSLRSFSIQVVPLSLQATVYNFFDSKRRPVGDDWKKILQLHTIIHPSNPNHAAIDIIIHREDVLTSKYNEKGKVFWMIQNKDFMESNAKIDVKGIVKKFIDKLNQYKGKYDKFDYVLIIAGATMNDKDAELKKSENFDSECDIVLLTGQRMQNHLLPIFRRRALYSESVVKKLLS